MQLFGDNGLFQKSRDAVNKYKTAQEDESKMLGDVSTQIENYNEQIDNTQGTTNTKKGSNNYAYNNPVIPAGFKTSLEGASWKSTDGKIVDGWNDGLIIEDEKGNQFVWVPVDGTNVPYLKWGTIGINYNSVTDDTLPEGVTSEENQINSYHGFYIARYEAGIPETMTSAIDIDIDDSMTDEEKMEKLGLSRNVIGTPVSMKNQVPWNYISYEKAKLNAENMYNSESNSCVKSGLTTGKQRDTVLKWLKNSGVNVENNCKLWGNYANAEVTGITEYSTRNSINLDWILSDPISKPAGYDWGDTNCWLLKTGNSEYTKRKNIYDLAGNVWEYANELYGDNCIYCSGTFTMSDNSKAIQRDPVQKHNFFCDGRISLCIIYTIKK